MQDMKEIKTFLENPSNIQSFINGNTLIWIDWREEDESIVKYVSNRIGKEIKIEHQNNGKPYGDDLIIGYGEKRVMMPYEEKMERDTTISTLNKLIMPDYEIRWFIESLGGDTLAYLVLSKAEWEALENEFGKKLLNTYFISITENTLMFDLSFEQIEVYFTLKDKYPNTLPTTLLSLALKHSQMVLLKEKKEKGEINLSTYMQLKKKIESEMKAIEAQIDNE